MLTNLGDVAVNKAVFIIHNEVFEILGREYPAFPHVAQTRLLQQLPAALEGPLSCQQLQLLGMRTMLCPGEEGPRREEGAKKQKQLLKIASVRNVSPAENFYTHHLSTYNFKSCIKTAYAKFPLILKNIKQQKTDAWTLWWPWIGSTHHIQSAIHCVTVSIIR